jgi:hypothetical protein
MCCCSELVLEAATAGFELHRKFLMTASGELYMPMCQEQDLCCGRSLSWPWSGQGGDAS